MSSELCIYAVRLREHINIWCDELALSSPGAGVSQQDEAEFSALAVMLFTLQFHHNVSYRKLCLSRRVTPEDVSDWGQIPAVPTAAFKEFEMTSLAPDQRTHVFHSSGTTGQRPSRHFHNADSLATYDASLWPWMCVNLRSPIYDLRFVSLTPAAAQVPHSSLVHMFDFAARKLGGDQSSFVGRVTPDGSWDIDFDAAMEALEGGSSRGLFLVGTAFSFVHLLDKLASRQVRLELPPGSRVLETGGYKGRSRSMPKTELHALIAERLGVPRSEILCEYGMSELSSQAYQQGPKSEVSGLKSGCVFQFPPWARARVVSPETGREVCDGEMGSLSVVDLANVFSVAAIQTEDLAIRRGVGFELIGRAALSEPRGCSLASA